MPQLGFYSNGCVLHITSGSGILRGMFSRLIASSVLITLALLFYSLGVWAERPARTKFHLYSFVVCLVPYFGGMFMAMRRGYRGPGPVSG